MVVVLSGQVKVMDSVKKILCYFNLGTAYQLDVKN